LSATWFFRTDEQLRAYGDRCWALETFAGLIRQLEVAGDEFGLHFHAYRRAHDGCWFQDYADPGFLSEALDSAISAYMTRFGTPRYFRFGDGWLSNETVDKLERSGVEYDLTLEPGQDGRPAPSPDRGLFPDLRRAPRLPYHPSLEDFRFPSATGGRRLWLLPITTTLHNHPGRWRSLNPWRGIATFNLALPTGFFARYTDHLLAQRPAFVLAVMRTGDVGEYPVLRNLDYLLAHPRIREFAFVSPPAAVEQSQRSTSLLT
jgi:hypothetical protein